MNPTGQGPQNGSVTETFILNVLYPPTINAIPNSSVVARSPLTVNCTISPGNPSLTSYKWSRSTDSWSQDGATLDMQIVQIADAAVYTCTAWNVMNPTGQSPQNGSVTETFTLNVLYPPTINAIPDRSVVARSRLTVTCTTTSGNPSATSYKWSRSTDNWSQDGATLDIPIVQIADAAVYTCTAWNVMNPTGQSPQNGSVTETFTLNVLYQTTISRFRITEETGSSPYTVDENSTGTFQCLVWSNPGSNLAIRGPRGVLAQQGDTRDITYATSLGCLDAGMYECSGYNYLNVADKQKKNLTLRVRCHPRPSGSVEPIIKVYKALHDPVTLNVSYIAYPPPTFRWFKQGSSGSDEYDPIPSETQKTFTIDDLKEPDFRQYKVEVANNIAPNYEQVYIIETQGEPEASMNITVEWTHNSAVVQWLPGFNGGLTQTFFIEYRKKADPEWSLVDAGEETTGVFNKTLVQLVPGTDYVLRMYAENSYDKSKVSEEISFRTLEAPDAGASTSGPGAAIGGGVGAAVVVIVGVVVVVVVVKRRQAAQKDKVKSTKNSNVSDGPVNDENQYYNLHSHPESTETYEGTGSQPYEDLQTTTKDSKLYDQLHRTRGDAANTNEDKGSTYEQLDPRLKQNDGVYDDISETQDTRDQSQRDGRIYINMQS